MSNRVHFPLLDKWYQLRHEDQKYDFILSNPIGRGGEGWVFEGEIQDCTLEQSRQQSEW